MAASQPRAAEACDLRVQVGEQPSLHQRIIGYLNARHQISGVEGDLLGFGEIVGGVAVQRQLPDQLHRNEFFRDQFGRVEQVDPLEAVGAVVGHHLNAELVLQEGAGLDRRRPCRGGGSPGRSRRRSAPLPTPGSAHRRRASSGT